MRHFALALLATTAVSAQSFTQFPSVDLSVPPVHLPEGATEWDYSEGGEGDQWVSEGEFSPSGPRSPINGGSATTQNCTQLNPPGTVIPPPAEMGLGGQIIVEQDGPGRDQLQYSGLRKDGAVWLTTPRPYSTRPVIQFFDAYASLTDSAGNVQVFEPCTGWEYYPARGLQTRVQGAGNLLVLLYERANGGILSALSPRSSTPVDLAYPAFATPMSGTGPSRRNLIVFRTGANQYSVFSAYAGAWTQINLTTPGTPTIQFGEDVLAIRQTDGSAWFVSSITGTATFRTLPTSAKLLLQDRLILISSGSDVSLYRARDGAITTLGGFQGLDRELLREADWGGFRVGTRFSVTSGIRRNAGWLWVDLGAGPVQTARNQTNLLVVHQPVGSSGKFAFYSAILNRWTVQSFSGTAVQIGSEPFVAWIYTGTKVYAMSARTGEIASAVVSPNTAIHAGESVVLARDGGHQQRLHAFGADSFEFRTVDLPGPPTNVCVRGDYALVTVDDRTLGSTVHFYGRPQDQWESVVTKVNVPSIDCSTFARRHGMLVVGKELLRFRAYSDVSPCGRDWPTSNPGSFRSFGGTGRVPFYAHGVPGSLQATMIATDRLRTPLRFPGIGRALELDPRGPVFITLPGPTIGRDGSVRFDLPMPPFFVDDLFMQTLVLTPGLEASFGTLHSFLTL